MTQLRRDINLSQEPIDTDRGRKLRSQDLDRDLAVMLHVFGEIGVRMSNRRIRLEVVTEGYAEWWVRHRKRRTRKELAAARESEG